MAYRCAILDDYQNVALKLADWSKITKDVDIKVFTEAVRRSDADTISDLQGLRHRRDDARAHPLSARGDRGAAEAQAAHHHRRLQRLDRHEGLRTSAASSCRGTGGFGNPTTGITFGLILELTRRIGWEHARMKSGVPWQTTLGMDIEGKTLGVLGLGKLGARAAGVGKAFGMKVIAWSQNLTPERCKEVGAEYVSKDDLFRNADVVTVHLQLSDRTRGLVGAKELGLMKKTAYVVNTSRGPIIEEKALLDALNKKQIAGAGLDVFDVEPLPLDHPLSQDGQRRDHAAPRLRQPAELRKVLSRHRREHPGLPRRQAHPRHRAAVNEALTSLGPPAGICAPAGLFVAQTVWRLDQLRIARIT